MTRPGPIRRVTIGGIMIFTATAGVVLAAVTRLPGVFLSWSSPLA
jgi:hypothetical protein